MLFGSETSFCVYRYSCSSISKQEVYYKFWDKIKTSEINVNLYNKFCIKNLCTIESLEL